MRRITIGVIISLQVPKLLRIYRQSSPDAEHLCISPTTLRRSGAATCWAAGCTSLSVFASVETLSRIIQAPLNKPQVYRASKRMGNAMIEAENGV
jgi:hypothetical protein